MKIFIKDVLNQIVFFLFKFIFYFHLLFCGSRKVCIVDIDNTIADSWPTLKQGIWESESERLLSLPCFIKMRQIIIQSSMQYHVFFLTARPNKTYFITRKWLKDNDLPVSLFNLLITPIAEKKISFLKMISPKFTVLYYDDLTYGHENGVVNYFYKILDEVQKRPYINYIGYDQIVLINQSNI